MASRRTLALVVMFALLAVFGLVGVLSIDQGRSLVAQVADTADQALKLKDAALAVESSRRLAALGRTADAAAPLAEAVEMIKTALAAEPAETRRARMQTLLPLAASYGEGFTPASGATLAAALAEFAIVQGRDVLEAEVAGSAAILNTAGLYAVLLIIVLGASIGAALLGLRSR